MNFLDNLLTRRPPSKAPDSKKDTRVFGQDITNIITEKCKVNQSFQQKSIIPKVEKVECRARSKSITTAEIVQEQKDVVFEYQTDIINEILKDNKCLRPIKSSAISLRMRAILVNWLVDIHSQFQLKEETLFLTIRLLDDYCAINEEVTKKTLQLIGITCLWMASKFEEIYPPKMKNYVTITDNTFNQNEIHETQAKILEALNFQVLKTTPLQYLSAILGSQHDTQMGSVCKYLFQLCNIQFLTTEYKPAVIVLSCLALGQRLLKQKTEVKKFKEWFNVQQDEINKCFKQLCKLIRSTTWQQLSSIKKKYNKPKFHSIAKILIDKI